MGKNRGEQKDTFEGITFGDALIEWVSMVGFREIGERK